MARDTEFLNAFRALAAFWVLSAHCVIWGDLTVPKWLDPKSAVDIFIVLSGFLMMLVASQPDRGSWAQFYVRRFFRIAPLYYLVLVAVVLLQDPFLNGYQQLVDLAPEKWVGSAFHPAAVEYDATNLLLHFTFLFGFLPGYSASTQLPDWSIGLEMQFYAAFPLLFLAQKRLGALAVGVAGAFVAAAWIWIYARGARMGLVDHFAEPAFLGFKLHMFMVGMLLFAGWKEQVAIRRLLLFGAAIGICVAQHRLFGTRSLTVTGLVVAMAILLWPTGWMDRERQTLNGILGGRFFGFFAELSYSAYLLHGFFLAIAGGAIASFAQRHDWSPEWRVFAIWAAVVPCTYVTSWATFALVERPMIRIGRRAGSSTAATAR